MRVQKWRGGIQRAQSLSEIKLHLDIFERCVAWKKGSKRALQKRQEETVVPALSEASGQPDAVNDGASIASIIAPAPPVVRRGPGRPRKGENPGIHNFTVRDMPEMFPGVPGGQCAVSEGDFSR